MIRRRRGRKEIIAPAGMEWAVPEEVEAGTNQGLAIMVARAHRWRELLEGGRYATVRELARDLGLDNSYVSRILRLTFLAPDIIEAIIDGDGTRRAVAREAVSRADGVGGAEGALVQRHE